MDYYYFIKKMGFLAESKINPLFKNFSVDKTSENIDYFLIHFDEIKKLDLDDENKELLYYLLNMPADEKLLCVPIDRLKTQHNKYAIFKSYLWYKTFEKSEEFLISVVDYFNTNINHYATSRLLHKEKEISELINQSMGAEKIKYLSHPSLYLFLPEQQPILHNWATHYEQRKEKEYLEIALKNDDKLEGKKHKL